MPVVSLESKQSVLSRQIIDPFTAKFPVEYEQVPVSFLLENPPVRQFENAVAARLFEQADKYCTPLSALLIEAAEELERLQALARPEPLPPLPPPHIPLWRS